MIHSVGIIGVGFVGGAMLKSFRKRCLLQSPPFRVIAYDKYQVDKYQLFKEVLDSDAVFLALPTPFTSDGYDISAIEEVCEALGFAQYKGLVVLKSTVVPGTTTTLRARFPSLRLLYNPEFLTARTADEDFDEQSEIIIGGPRSDELNLLDEFYSRLYPKATIHIGSAEEAESVKTFRNTFYAVKVQMFNEFFALCQSLDIDYDRVRHLMTQSPWVEDMHTQVPGPDGELSYGGACFPKDTQALLSLMREKETPSAVLAATVAEREIMRCDE